MKLKVKEIYFDSEIQHRIPCFKMDDGSLRLPIWISAGWGTTAVWVTPEERDERIKAYQEKLSKKKWYQFWK